METRCRPAQYRKKIFRYRIFLKTDRNHSKKGRCRTAALFWRLEDISLLYRKDLIFPERKTEESAFTCKSAALCILAAAGVVSGNVNGGCGAPAVFVIGTFFCFAVNVDFFTAALASGGICDGIIPLLPEALAACFVCAAGRGTGNFDGSFGTELIFVVNTGCCAAVKNCHNCALLVDFRLS